MQWYEILSVISSIFAVITFSVFTFNCFISIKKKLPARVKVNYANDLLKDQILYCKEFQDFFVFIPCEIKNKSLPKIPMISNVSLSYCENGKIIKLTPLMPPEIRCIDSFKSFYEHYQYSFYGSKYVKLNDSSKMVIFTFLIRDKTFIKHQSTTFAFSFKLSNSFKKHFKKEIVLYKEDIGPYPIKKIEKHVSEFHPTIFDANFYEGD